MGPPEASAERVAGKQPVEGSCWHDRLQVVAETEEGQAGRGEAADRHADAVGPGLPVGPVEPEPEVLVACSPTHGDVLAVVDVPEAAGDGQRRSVVRERG